MASVVAAASRNAGRARPRQLRVAFLWSGTLQDEEILTQPRSVVLGDGPDALFALPDGASLESNVTVLSPGETGYELFLGPGMGGEIWMDGRRTEVRDLAAGGPRLAVKPGDYGVVTLGTVAVFFQYVKAIKPLPRPWFGSSDGPLAAAMALSLFLFTALMSLMYMASDEFANPEPLELPSDLLARFLVTPPPEELVEEANHAEAAEESDPGLEERDEADARRHRGDSGQVGHEDSTDERIQNTAPPTDRTAEYVHQNSMLANLQEAQLTESLALPSIREILDGTGDIRTIMPRGFGGLSTSGDGGGGGGEDDGALLGEGDGVDTTSTPTGSNTSTMRRERAEHQVDVRRGNPDIENGYLSPRQINRVVRAHQSVIRFCYESQLHHQPRLRGNVSVRFRIGMTGRVRRADIATSSLNNTRVHGCMLRAIRGWQFPQPDGGEVVVTYPFFLGVAGR